MFGLLVCDIALLLRASGRFQGPLAARPLRLQAARAYRLGVLPARDLHTLRHEAAGVLSAIQELEGFKERLVALPRLPGELGEWRWRHLVVALRDDRPGRVRWDWRPASEVPEELAITARTTPGNAGEDEAGNPWLRVPLIDEQLPQESVDEVESYHRAVVGFADQYVLGAEWSARAVHLALRSDDSIRLPPAPPRPHVSVNASIRLDYGAGEPISPAMAVAMADALAEAEPHSAVLAYRDQAQEGNQRILEVLEGAAKSYPPSVHLAKRFRELLELYERCEESGRNRAVRPHERDAMWDGAIEYVSRALRGESPGETGPSRSRAKRYLNAAVNGVFDCPIPVEVTDSKDYEDLKALLEDATKAIRVARALQSR